MRILIVLSMFSSLSVSAQSSNWGAQTTSVPHAIYQCEGDQCTNGGGGAVWLFQGNDGQAMWHYGAIANLTVKAFDGQNIWIHREDPNPSYSSPRYADLRRRPDGVFFADYRGTIRGDHIDGTVSWNGGGNGTWYATITDRPCETAAVCPLNVNQLIQLGRNALGAKLQSSALQCFWGAAQQGNSDAQSLAGVMIRDGIGAQPNPQLGLTLIKQSASQNNPNGELALSQTYEAGLGVAKDLQEAAYWKNKAYNRFQEIRQQQEQQKANAQLGEYVLGAVVIGALAVMVAGVFENSGPSSSHHDASIDESDRFYRSQEMSRKGDWYSHGGGIGGPPPSWKTGDPVPQD